MDEPTNNGETPKEIIRAMQIICVALMLGIIVFGSIIFVVISFNGPAMQKEQLQKAWPVFAGVVVALGIAALVGSTIIYKKAMASINNSSFSLVQRLNQYRASLTRYMAICEGPALFSIILFFLTGNAYVLLVAAVMLLLMSRKAPLKKKIISELNLDWKDQQDIE